MEKASDILKQILFGGRLEDKLAGAHLHLNEIEWDHALVEMPEQPGRDGVLQPKAQKGVEKNAFPKRNELKVESTRGKLLHFFANHELLAIETMAYTLLKFPNAPIEFKRGVMKTIQDEQRHMGLYLGRMHDYGVDLGGVPLNLYFWNILKTMQSPLDFVARMSLTFEQANLDFALEYAKLFEEEIADEKTAQLLRVVHDDEVKHVAHGLKWFNEWRDRGANGNETEFESYQKLLPFPLTARRGKGGKFFSAESRIDAGFSEDFVLSMKVAGGSRGKVPDYFYFNPLCEIESQAIHSAGALNANLLAKVADLAPLVLWLAQEDDVVELDRKPDLRWMEKVIAVRGELAEVITPEASGRPNTHRYAAFEELKPWGWGESAWKKLTEIKKQVRHLPKFNRTDPAQKFFSKEWWKTALKTAGVEVFGEVIADGNEWSAWAEKIKTGDVNARFLLKSSVSSTGRGHLSFSADMLNDPALMTKIQKRIQKEGAVVIEPLLNKKIDFSTQYEILLNGEVKASEPKLFLVDSRFQFAGTLLGNWSHHLEYSEYYRVIRENLKALRETHHQAIAILKEQGYIGPLGIDSLIYDDNGLKIAAIIEVNARFTMGRVANEIERSLERKHGNKPALWKFLDKSETPESLLNEYGNQWLETSPFEQARSTWSAVIWSEKIQSTLQLNSRY